MKIPHAFFIGKLPEAERPEVSHIESLLIRLNMYVDSFESAVLLNQFTQTLINERLAKIASTMHPLERLELRKAMSHDKTMEWKRIAIATR